MVSFPGPAVVTKDEISNPHNLRMACSVNGSKMQDGSTGDMIHNIHAIVSYLSGLVLIDKLVPT